MGPDGTSEIGRTCFENLTHRVRAPPSLATFKRVRETHLREWRLMEQPLSQAQSELKYTGPIEALLE